MVFLDALSWREWATRIFTLLSLQGSVLDHGSCPASWGLEDCGGGGRERGGGGGGKGKLVRECGGLLGFVYGLEMAVFRGEGIWIN